MPGRVRQVRGNIVASGAGAAAVSAPVMVAAARAQLDAMQVADVRGARENFHVLSLLLPRRLRADFASLYAFCRTADDIADESGDPGVARDRLRRWRADLRASFAGRPRTAVFVALRETVRRHALPIEPFEQLLDAFEQDQVVTRYESWAQLIDYCGRSANPVGRLVLMVGGCRRDDAEAFAMSDATCTGLQLANHWQDVRRDVLDRDRIYLPREIAQAHGLSVERLATAVRDGSEAAVDGPVRETLRALVARTWPLFERGRRLPCRAPRDLRPTLALFTLGGEAVLRHIERGGFATHRRRPEVGRFTKLLILARGWAMSREHHA
jgi:squalene synthase HpnC